MSQRVLDFIRKSLLVINGLIFAAFAVATIIDLTWTAGFYALSPVGIGGLSEFRAVFMGFWLGLTIVSFTALRHYPLAIVGDMVFTLTLMQSLGRVVSLVVDGVPPVEFIAFGIGEFLLASIGLAIRPHPRVAPDAAAPAPPPAYASRA